MDPRLIEADEHGARLCARYGHDVVETYTRPWRAWFRRRRWLRCWRCSLAVSLDVW